VRSRPKFGSTSYRDNDRYSMSEVQFDDRGGTGMLQDQSRRTERIRQIKAELNRQRHPEVQRQFAEERREAIAGFEARYGIPSDQIHQAIEDGRLVETFEVNQWLHLWEIEQHARRKAQTTRRPTRVD
jgi:hypothetical protein